MIVAPVSVEAAADLLSRAVQYQVGGPGALHELVDGCAVFGLFADGRMVGAFAVEVLDAAAGRVMHVTAAGGLPGYDHTAAIDEWLDREARGHVQARSVRAVTRRPGLVKRLGARGWRVAGYVMERTTA